MAKDSRHQDVFMINPNSRTREDQIIQYWEILKPQNVGTCYKMKYININVPPSQDFIEAKELKS